MTDRDLSLDHVLERIVDRRATLHDWRAFDAQLERTPELARELAERLREDDYLRGSLAPLRAAAESVALPAHTARRSVWTQANFVAGFAAALLVGVACALLVWPRDHAPREAHAPEAASPLQADELLQRYVALGREQGTVLEELPSVPISMERDEQDTNAVQVVFVRRIVERTRVREAVRFASDEHGRSVALPPTKITSILTRDI